MTQLSAHFSDREAACHHCGRLPPDGIPPALVHGLEALRSLAYPQGLVVGSWYRCAAYNKAIPNAAPDSQHVQGSAVDPKALSTRATLVAVRGLHAFSGIGWTWHGGLQVVKHVDVRHASGHNPTHGTTAAPTTWEYLADGTRR